MARTCICCDANASMTRFEAETLEVTYRGLKKDVGGLSGYRC